MIKLSQIYIIYRLFFGLDQSYSLKTLSINLPSICRKLLTSFDLGINGLLNGFVLYIQVSFTFIHLGFNSGAKAILKEPNQDIFFKSVTRSNSFNIIYKYSRLATLFLISSSQYQEFFRIFCQMLSTKILDFSRLYWRQALNFSHVIGIIISLSSFHLYYCQRNKAWSQRNKVPKKIWLVFWL